ncbi:type II toxin-antitoxin system death-on-curing family toxin [Nocardia sp. NPDC052566]|uniref:type II toxin-antitoxin system death-on-curing family toxin n=1 Tax=Nocardia sp. NPDC052566 TaxID=3364330 RepID=UPI0037CA800A
MRFLEVDDVLEIAYRVTDGAAVVRDPGLLQAAVFRYRTTVFGEDAYPTVFDKAAALLESLARNNALVDGNKRTAWTAAVVFLGINGYRVTLDNAPTLETYPFVIAVATGELDGIEEIAARLAKFAGQANTEEGPQPGPARP